MNKTSERRQGHSALRVKDGKLNVFDPNPRKGEWEKAVCHLPSELRVRDWMNRCIGAIVAVASTIVCLLVARWPLS